METAPVLGNPLGEEFFPSIQSKLILVQLEAISSSPITCSLGEETDPRPDTNSCQAGVESDEVSASSRLSNPSSLSSSSSGFFSRPFTSFVALLRTCSRLSILQ